MTESEICLIGNKSLWCVTLLNPFFLFYSLLFPPPLPPLFPLLPSLSSLPSPPSPLLPLSPPSPLFSPTPVLLPLSPLSPSLPLNSRIDSCDRASRCGKTWWHNERGRTVQLQSASRRGEWWGLYQAQNHWGETLVMFQNHSWEVSIFTQYSCASIYMLYSILFLLHVWQSLITLCHVFWVHHWVRSILSLTFIQGQGSHAPCTLILWGVSLEHVEHTRKSSVIMHFIHSDVFEIVGRIIFNFYPELPHTVYVRS